MLRNIHFQKTPYLHFIYSFHKIVTVFIPLLKMYVAWHTKRQVIKMRKFDMFITAVCVLFLVKHLYSLGS